MHIGIVEFQFNTEYGLNLSGHEIEFLCQEIQYSKELEKVYFKLKSEHTTCS